MRRDGRTLNAEDRRRQQKGLPIPAKNKGLAESMPVILLVDDDPAVLEALRRVFVDEGMHVIAARNGEEAIERLGTVRPDLVITDLRMGAVSGLDLVFHFHLERSGLPFFVITGLPRRECEGVEKIADGFFQKPLNLEALIKAVHDHLGTSA